MYICSIKTNKYARTKIQKYKKSGNRGLFDEQETSQKLSIIGNPLEMISIVIDFEVFRENLESKLLNQDKKNNAGAKPYDVVMMFKIMILQRYYGLGEMLPKNWTEKGKKDNC